MDALEWSDDEKESAREKNESLERRNKARKALDLEPTSPAIIDSWGWVLFHQGKYEEALVELERAYAGLKDPEVAAHIVETLWKLDRAGEARGVLEDAELLFPENPLLERVRERVFPEEP